MSDTELAFRATMDGSGFANGMQSLEGSLNRFGIQTNTATANIGGLGTVIGTLANPATAAALAITSVGAGLASAVTTAGDFQQKMAGVNAIVGGSAADMQTLSNAAREAGASTSFSASQAADALGYMAGAGWDVQSSTTALKDTLTLAAAGGMDLAAAGDLMTGTVAQFGLKAEDAGRVANVLAAGASATNTSVSQLGAGMTVVGSTANAFGMSLESTTAALGTLSNANIKGAEGGTALRGVLASLATQSGTATAALAELGVTNEQINPEMVSLGDAMQLLQDRGMTASQAIAIFGRENVSAATYMAAHASELDGLESSITGTGKASEMAATMTDTYQGAMGELSSAVEEAQIALGTVLLPIVTDTIDLFTAGVTAATDFGKSISSSYTEFQTGTLASLDESFLNFLGIDSTTAEAAGAEAAASVADGVKASDDLQKATGDALGSDASKAAVRASADDLAKEFTKQYGSQFEAGMTLINGVWTSQAAAVADKIDEQTVYLKDQEYILRSINSGENMVYQIREKSTGELIKATLQLRQTNDLLTSEAWAMAEGYDTRLRKTITFDVLFDSATAIKSKMEDIGEQAAGAFKDGIVTASEQETLAALVAEYTAMGGDASDALITAILTNDWYGVGQKIGAKTAGGLVDSMTGTQYSVGEERSLADLLKPGGSAAIADWDQWSENVLQPSLQKSFDEMHTIQDRGYKKDIAQTEEWIADKMSRLDEYGDAFSEDQITLFSMWEDQIITTKEFYDQWAKLTEEGTDSVQKAYAGSGLYYGDFAAETDTWQDYALEGGGYIGPTEHYDEYMAQVEKQISGAEEAMRNIKTMDLSIDTTLAVADTQALIDEINVANPVLSVMLDTSVADSQFQNLYRLITEARPTMPIEISVDAYQIRAEVRAAIAEAIQNA